jgi:hypothetical protein
MAGYYESIAPANDFSHGWRIVLRSMLAYEASDKVFPSASDS